MKLKAILNVAIGAAMAVGMGAMTAPAAQAASRDGVCGAGEFCYFYNTGPAGSVSDFTVSVANYGTSPSTCYVFKGAGAGQGECIKNNAAAVRNNSSQTVRIYYNSGYNAGHPNSPSIDIAPGAERNLKGTQLYNNNASHQFLGTTTTPPPAGGLINPYPGAIGPNGGWTARSAWLRDQIKARYPALECKNYVSPAGSDHATGNAMNCWGDLTTRRNLQYWAAGNARSLEVWYVIHEQKIFSLTYPDRGWTRMGDAGSITKNHYDHVHISMQSPTKEF